MMTKLGLALLASVFAVPASAATYNPFTEFNGTNRTANFRFGYSDATFAGMLTPFQVQETASCDGTVELVCVRTNFTDALAISKAVVNGGTFNPAGTNFWQANELNLHPSSSDQRAGVQFIAPRAGSYTIEGLFSRNDDVATSRQAFAYIGAAFNSSSIFTVSAPISGTLTLAAGGTVTFLLGTGPDGYTFDSTGLSLLITGPDAQGFVPEPATWAMMIGGFGMAGGALRRRKTASVRFA